AVGYMIMSFIMTATPVSMHVMDGHSLRDTKFVIQSHILAMFLPSLIAGWVIKKLGTTKMMIIGLITYLICAVIAFSGHHLGNYWISLVLLGIGWNFLFVGGTTLLPQSYRTSERFKVQALNDFVVFGSQAIAALSAGWLVFLFNWETILVCTIPVILFQMFVVLKWASKKR
ncbi:MAG: MFS transporter, partial [Cyclobacteriaceae bacterium]|nr:MFS transporter [Cyclobacteriaceae bacterium]